MASEQVIMFKFVVLSALVACALGAAIPDGMLPQLDGRIVGGSDTSIGNYPYIVSIQRSGSHSCGGSIYSTRVIVTAAHCLQGGVSVSVLKVRAGSTTWNSGGTQVSVASYTNHPSYNANTMVNDIAVLRLSTALTTGSNIRTIPLATSTPGQGTNAVVAGWGVKSSGSSSIPTTLQHVQVQIVSRNTCASGTYSYGAEIRDTMLCASAAGKDACQGDSGGPLAVGNSLVGVVSWGYGCAQPKYPGVYANVADLYKWVQSNA